MSNTDTSLKVRGVAAGVFGLNLDDVAAHASSESLVGWDSLGHLNLMLAIEAEFGVTFSVEELGELRSIAAIVAALRSR